jgi:2-polyprenyl-3-methyl-5-hydroxy-6-metoxy-1,4-benzoquinol methylase
VRFALLNCCPLEATLTNSTTQRSPCIACNAAAASVVLRGATPRSQGCALLRCSQCGHVYLDGWGTAFDRELYAYYARRVGKTREEVYDEMNTRRQRDLLDWLGARTTGRRLLDVGCGQGQFVDTASSAGWRAFGIDLAKDAIAIARSFGVECREEDFFASTLDGERFDVITMTELIEHVPAPGRFLQRARELLGPGGLLYLTTPNFSSLSRRIMGGEWYPVLPEHLSYFTPRVLCELAVKDAGLELVSAETRNFDPNAALYLAKAASRIVRRRRASNGATERRRGPPASSGAPPPESAAQRLRRLLERSPALRTAKRAVNAGLSVISGVEPSAGA